MCDATLDTRPVPQATVGDDSVTGQSKGYNPLLFTHIRQDIKNRFENNPLFNQELNDIRLDTLRQSTLRIRQWAY